MILTECGYNCSASVGELNLNNIIEAEKYFDENLKDKLQNLDCCYADSYKNQKTFRFLPAHRNLILKFPQNSTISHVQHFTDTSVNDFSTLLKMLIETAERNANKVPTLYRYSETIRYFAMYIFIMVGRMSYEILSKNLPLPQTSTTRK